MKTYTMLLHFMTAVAICSISSISFAQVTYSGQATAPVNKLVLWYRQAATNWMTSADR
jgi:hypothetical protein